MTNPLHSEAQSHVSDLGWVKWVLFGIAAVFLAWRIVTLGLAEHYVAQGEPERALMLRPAHPAALQQMAIQSFESDPNAARIWLERALSANPVHGMSYARLGALWELGGASDKAGLAIDTALELAPAEVDVRLIAAAVALGRDDLVGLLDNWDVAMTRRGALRREFYPLLLALAAYQENLPAFAALVDSHPMPWWPGFVAHAAANAEQLDVAMRLFNLSQSSEYNALSGHPFGAVLRRLQREGLWLDAHLAWMDSLPGSQLDNMGNLFNGSFEQAITDIGFDWMRSRAGHIVVEPAPTHAVDGEHALYVHFRGPRVQFRHLSQLLLLPPGEYVLRGHARPDGFEAVHGLMWTVACTGSGERRIAQTPHFKGRGPWRSFDTAFAVPADNCPAQIVRLQLDGRVPLDFEASGTVWFDAMSVELAVGNTQ